MREMFKQASSFNQPLNDWDVSKVQTMNNMFMYALAFNQPLWKWDWICKAADKSTIFDKKYEPPKILCIENGLP